jgi:hypothetical protein
VVEALENVKHHLQSPPILTAPLHGEELLLYIAATTHVVSTTIVVERPEEGHAYGVQRPIYFICKVLSESKVRYPSIQKILYGSSATTSTSTRSQLLLISHWRIYSTIGMPLEGFPIGQ